jgi:hypothetical protein
VAPIAPHTFLKAAFMFVASGGTTSSEFMVFPHSPTPTQKLPITRLPLNWVISRTNLRRFGGEKCGYGSGGWPRSRRHIGAWSLAMDAKYPQALVRLDGAGDDFRIIGQVTKAMRRVGIPEEEIENFCDEAISGHDHDLLRICGRWVTLVPE